MWHSCHSSACTSSVQIRLNRLMSLKKEVCYIEVLDQHRVRGHSLCCCNLPPWCRVSVTAAAERQREGLVCPPQHRRHLSFLFIYLFVTNSQGLNEAAVMTYTPPPSSSLLTSLCSPISSFPSPVLHLHLVACWPTQESCVCVCVCRCESLRRYSSPY